jgi:hypothetical protein
MKMDDDSMNTDKPVGYAAQMQSAESDDKKKSTKANRLDRATRAKLGQQLRAVYDEVVNQGVPNRFADLLNRLDNEGKADAR